MAIWLPFLLFSLAPSTASRCQVADGRLPATWTFNAWRNHPPSSPRHLLFPLPWRKRMRKISSTRTTLAPMRSLQLLRLRRSRRRQSRRRSERLWWRWGWRRKKKRKIWYKWWKERGFTRKNKGRSVQSIGLKMTTFLLVLLDTAIESPSPLLDGTFFEKLLLFMIRVIYSGCLFI